MENTQSKDPIRITEQKEPPFAPRKRLDEGLFDPNKRKVLMLRGQVQVADIWLDLRAMEVDQDLSTCRNTGQES